MECPEVSNREQLLEIIGYLYSKFFLKIFNPLMPGGTKKAPHT